jgi:seryl-tRNA(Sec) selenium transferase
MNRMLRTLTISTGAAAVALGLAAAPANAQDRHVQVINETSQGIVQFFASNVDRGTWEEDILGEAVLPVGQSVNINIDDGSGACLYDFKAVFEDGQELVRNGIDVCTTSTYTYTEN